MYTRQINKYNLITHILNTWRIAILVSVGLLTYLHAEAQRDFKYKFISRVLVGDSTDAPVRNCHIINITQHIGTITDEYGSFTITANVRDSVKFTAIGFYDLVIAVTDSMYQNDRMIRMAPKTYELGEVSIGLLSTYDRFKQDLLSKEATPLYPINPISKFEVYPGSLPNQGGIRIPGLGSPVTFLYNLWSKEGKQQRRYLSIVNRTAEHMLIGEKFNGEIVGKLTGLQDDELIAFMSSCLFTKDYLLQASQKEINRMVMWKYKKYMAKDAGE